MARTSGSGSQASLPHPPLTRSSATTPSSATALTSTTTPTSAAPTPDGEGTTPSSRSQPALIPVDEGRNHDHEAIDVDDDDVLVRGKRKLKSDVWLEFEPVDVAGKTEAQCKWCTKTFSWR
jgi:hypothetical protein